MKNDNESQEEEEEARRRFERTAGGLLQVTPQELEEAETPKKAPSDNEQQDASEDQAEDQ